MNLLVPDVETAILLNAGITIATTPVFQTGTIHATNTCYLGFALYAENTELGSLICFHSYYLLIQIRKFFLLNYDFTAVIDVYARLQRLARQVTTVERIES